MISVIPRHWRVVLFAVLADVLAPILAFPYKVADFTRFQRAYSILVMPWFWISITIGTVFIDLVRIAGNA